MIPHSKPWITEEDRNSVMAVLQSGMIAQGELVETFENSVSQYLNLESAIATASGTEALVLALQVLGVGKKSEVILPTYVCRNVLQAVVKIGATPCICDVGPNWVMTFNEVEPLLSKKTAAIIAVHIFGLPVDVQSLQSFGVPVIEDACQAFGLNVNGVSAGGTGDIGLFSFHATKCFTTAEGGMLVSNNSQLMKEAKQKRDGDGRIAAQATASLSDLQAALGLSQLARYDSFLDLRRKLKLKYFEALNCVAAFQLPDNDIEFFFRYPMRVPTSPDVLQAKLAECGIHIRKGVDQLLHREQGLSDRNYPSAVKALNQTISIPFYPALSDDSCEFVINNLIGIFK